MKRPKPPVLFKAFPGDLTYRSNGSFKVSQWYEQLSFEMLFFHKKGDVIELLSLELDPMAFILLPRILQCNGQSQLLKAESIKARTDASFEDS